MTMMGRTTSTVGRVRSSKRALDDLDCIRGYFVSEKRKMIVLLCFAYV